MHRWPSEVQDNGHQDHSLTWPRAFLFHFFLPTPAGCSWNPFPDQSGAHNFWSPGLLPEA